MTAGVYGWTREGKKLHIEMQLGWAYCGAVTALYPSAEGLPVDNDQVCLRCLAGERRVLAWEERHGE